MIGTDKVEHGIKLLLILMHKVLFWKNSQQWNSSEIVLQSCPVERQRQNAKSTLDLPEPHLPFPKVYMCGTSRVTHVCPCRQ